MKKIVSFRIATPEGCTTLDVYNPVFHSETASFSENLVEVLPELLPYNRIFEQITLKNWKSIPKILMERLTVQYLHGCKIIIDAPKQEFKKVYGLKDNLIQKMYTYSWNELDLSKPIPKSLANFEFKINGKTTTYLKEISKLHNTRYLPNVIWNALDKYSQSQIEKCKEYNKNIDYSLAEKWYNLMCKDCIKHGITVFSPNEKTWYEVLAQINFERDIKETKLEKGLQPLNEEQLGFLYTFARIYGVEIPKVQWRYNFRKTNHGYTQEIELVPGGMSNSDWEKATYDYRNKDKSVEDGGNLPKDIRQKYIVQSEDCDKYLRDAYFQLKWIIKHLGDEALMPGWHRCPKCHKLYHEKDGCECGHCQPLHQFEANNLFYGIPSAEDDDFEPDDEYDENDWE